tara:strand:+ start:12680 stop:13171 length:492 start_codon:yes stop_codon:yes gene_type:complete
MKRTFSITGKTTVYILVLSIIAWILGTPFIFPSLGPTAYILAFDQKRSHSARVVIGGHACGVLGGLMSYYLLVDPYDLMMITEAISTPSIFLGLGAVISIAVTTFLMLLFQVSHPPACATTLIISLGILPHWHDGLIILIAVVILYYTYRLFQKTILERGLPE